MESPRCGKPISASATRYPTGGSWVWAFDEIPHFATISHAFCKCVPPELAGEIFEHIFNKTLNYRMVEPSVLIIDRTHIKASANKKKQRKELMARAEKVYEAQLREEVNAERAALGKPPVKNEP